MKEFSTEAICEFFGRTIPLIQGPRFGWRLKAKLAIRGSAKSPQIGLFREGTHDVIDMPSCTDHHPRIDEALCLVRQGIAQELIEPYDENRAQGNLRYVQCFVSRRTKQVQLVLVARVKQEALRLATALWQKSSIWHSIWINIQTKADNQILGDEWHLCFGEPFLFQTIGRAEVAFHPAAFAQANLDLFDRILERIEEWVPRNARLIEVYAGVGGISLHLAPRLHSAILIEENPYAYLSYQRSAKEESFCYIQGEAKDAAAFLKKGDCIIVDPPRKGLDRHLVEALKEVQNQTLIYISCSFKSFVKDANELLDSGWQIEDVGLYWLFPGTDHVELAVKWKKSG